MANFGEISGIKQWGIALAGAVLVCAALYFTYFKTQRDANAQAQQALDAKVEENNKLEPYRAKLSDINREIANLKQQLDIERRIVPDDKQVDEFMKVLDAEAVKAGVELRRFTAKPITSKEFYSEVPFDIELDGPYYSVLTFFDQVSKLERIVNISDLLMANTKKGSEAKAKHAYKYAANESVVATCTATTYFSHDSGAATPAAARAGATGSASPNTVAKGRI